MKTKVTIIIPVYNVEKYIEKCLKSVVQQTYSNIEIIVINDGSTDDSGSICEKFLKNDKRIIYIKQSNKGVSFARNAGLKKATGKYICFLDSDDYLDINYVDILLKNALDNNADIIECGYFLVDTTYKMLNDITLKQSIVENNIDLCIDFAKRKGPKDFIWNKLFKKRLWNNVEFSNLKCSEDFEVLCRIFLKVKKYVSICDCLYYYVQRENSICHENFSLKKFDTIYARESIMKYYDEEKLIILYNIMSIQILYEIIVLYSDILNSEDISKKLKAQYKDWLYKKFLMYFKISKNVNDKMFNKLIRNVKGYMFLFNPFITVRLYNYYKKIKRKKVI